MESQRIIVDPSESLILDDPNESKIILWNLNESLKNSMESCGVLKNYVGYQRIVDLSES